MCGSSLLSAAPGRPRPGLPRYAGSLKIVPGGLVPSISPASRAAGTTVLLPGARAPDDRPAPVAFGLGRTVTSPADEVSTDDAGGDYTGQLGGQVVRGLRAQGIRTVRMACERPPLRVVARTVTT